MPLQPFFNPRARQWLPFIFAQPAAAFLHDQEPDWQDPDQPAANQLSTSSRTWKRFTLPRWRAACSEGPARPPGQRRRSLRPARWRTGAPCGISMHLQCASAQAMQRNGTYCCAVCAVKRQTVWHRNTWQCLKTHLARGHMYHARARRHICEYLPITHPCFSSRPAFASSPIICALGLASSSCGPLRHRDGRMWSAK